MISAFVQMIGLELTGNSRGSEMVIVFIDGVVGRNLILACIQSVRMRLELIEQCE